MGMLILVAVTPVMPPDLGDEPLDRPELSPPQYETSCRVLFGVVKIHYKVFIGESRFGYFGFGRNSA